MQVTQGSSPLHSPALEAKILATLEECLKKTQLQYIHHFFEAELGRTWKEDSLDCLKAGLQLASDPAFQKRLQAEMAQRFTKKEDEEFDEYEFTSLPNTIAYEFLSEVIRRITSSAVNGIEDAIASSNTERLKTALRDAENAVTTLCQEYYFFECDGLYEGKPKRISRETFDTDSWKLQEAILALTSNGSHGRNNSSLGKISDKIPLAQFYVEILENFPKLDTESLAKDKSIYGAKGAHLLALNRAEEPLRSFFDKIRVAFKVPEFKLIPITEYQNHKSDPSQSPFIQEIYAWAQGTEVMIRSSAVHSEDGEHLGAGVYQSFLLPSNASFDLLCEVVGKVYASVDSPLAKEYRKRIGCLHDEQMGVIVQRYIPSSYSDPAGHINTMRPRMPSVCDVVAQRRYIPQYVSGKDYEIINTRSVLVPLYREHLSREFVGGDLDTHALVLPTDHTKAEELSDWQAAELGKVGLLLERYFQSPLQIEYVCAEHSIHGVQVRPLPAHWIEPAQITFPERQDWLWKGESFGILDEVLPILPDSRDNCERKGLVILDSGHMASENIGWLESILPREGAVWMLRPSATMRGHIESRCAERGVVVITGETPRTCEADIEAKLELFQRLWRAYGSDASSWLFNSRSSRPVILAPHAAFSQLRVVSDGFEARVYTEQSNKPESRRLSSQ